MTATDFDFAPLEATASVAAPGSPTPDPAAEAAMLRAAAEAEAEAVRAAAHAEGLAAGREEAMAGVVPAAEALVQAAAELQAGAAAHAERLEAQAVELALLLADKVLGAAVAADPELVVEAVRGALRGLVERERVTVLVNPADFELVREAMGGVAATLGGIEHCDVQAERRVGRGGAVVRTPDGDVDAQIGTKLERAREVVAAALGAA